MALKMLFLLFLAAAVLYTQASESSTLSKEGKAGLELQDVARHFGFGGGDEVCEDCDSGQTLENDPTENYEVDHSTRALVKQILHLMKYKYSDKRKPPLSMHFFKKIIAECVRDVVSKVNCSALISVDKTFLENARGEVQNAFENLVLKLDAKLLVFKQALNNTIPFPGTEPSFNQKDIEDYVGKIIKTSILEIKPFVEFVNVMSRKYDVKLKTVREIINENIKTITNSLRTSRCITVRKSSVVFCKCVEPIYKNFIWNLKRSIEDVEALSKTVQIVLLEATQQVHIAIVKVLKSAEIRINKVLNDIADLVLFENNKNGTEKNVEESKKLIDFVGKIKNIIS